MTQPYGQQPDPSGGYPQQGGTPPGGYPQQGTPPGGYPQQGTPPGGYPQAPGYPQGYPAAPVEQGQGGPIVRPGNVTAAAVLCFVQAGLTLLSAFLFLIALATLDSVSDTYGFDPDNSNAEFWIASLLGLVAGGLLIAGGVKALAGANDQLFAIAIGLQLVLSLYWMVRLVTLEGSPLWPILMAVMPVIAISLWYTAPAKQYVAAKSGPRY